MRHHGAIRGAHEEIAFPGFTVLAMSLLALWVPSWRALGALGPRKLGVMLGRWLAIAALAAAATLLTQSMLAAAIVFVMGIWQERRVGAPLPFSNRRGLYLAVLLLAVAMFLGLAPLQWNHTPVHGLYYYFHTYFPGFNGIRKVSRQAVMTTFAFAVLSSFGSAWLFSKLVRPWTKALAFSVLLATTCFELRSFPHPLKTVWAGPTVPDVYGFLATLPAEDRVVALPLNAGASLFRGDAGLALHNYLMLYHKHRSLNGQSSWLPPVTDLVEGALRHLPDDGARRVLQSVGARHILVHAGDLPGERRNLPEQLENEPDHYRRVFQQGSDSVFSLLPPNGPSLDLLATPTLPAGARALPSSELLASTNLDPTELGRAIDGNLGTFWAARSLQARGQTFELLFKEPHVLVAFEIDNPNHVTHVPLSFELSVGLGRSGWQRVIERPALRLYREQVYSPKGFVFRVVFPQPSLADRLRITIGQPVPGKNLVIHEARIYERAP